MQTDEPVPEALKAEVRRSAVSMLAVRPLLERIRAGCAGPIVLMKGPELAIHYPGSARGFLDIDLLVPEASRVHEQLKSAGFIETGDAELFHRLHHLRPLRWPDLPVPVEIHQRPKWPERLPPPATIAIFRAAVPSGLCVDGILAPEPAQHTLLVAAHAWAHQPLRTLRDLIDIRALSTSAGRAAIEQTAGMWGLTHLWRTTDRVTDAVLAGTQPRMVPSWARHLREMRERTVLENHLQAWLSPFSSLPPRRALAAAAGAFASDLAPTPEEGWPEKLSRVLTASRHATIALSRHNRLLGDAATRGRKRNAPPDDESV
jgi:Uncharacterised nucleotidyltransferase